MALLLALHALSAIVWVGGMFFAYMALRPVAATNLQPPVRLTLWRDTFNRFFPWVWVAVVALPVSGYWMVGMRFAGMGNAPVYVHVMNGLGLLMVVLFLYVYFIPFRGLDRAVTAQEWPTAGNHLGRIRQIIGINLVLGLVVSAVGSGGRFLGF